MTGLAEIRHLSSKVIDGGKALDMEWRGSAACQFVDTDLFFPEKGGSNREAKLICAGCPVRAECLADALAHQDRHGIWGGLSDHERRRLQPARSYAQRPIRHGTVGGYYTHRRRDESPCRDCRYAASLQQEARRRHAAAVHAPMIEVADAT